MVFGGIPYYMRYVDGEFSLAQNIDNIVFAKNAKLKDEYDRLFASGCSKSLACVDVCPMKIPTLSSMAKMNR